MDEDNKIPAFEYILLKLNDWYHEVFPNKKEEENDISILKAMKLLFFTASVNRSDKGGEHEDLLDIFGNFQAWPYGHVEADVYNNFRNSTNIVLDRHKLIISNIEAIENWANKNPELSNKINGSIKALKEKNIDLIKKGAFDLVDISHSYLTWIYYHQYRKEHNTTIPIAEIRNEEKYYS
ncbi:Panacea domain-containing protein [Riemerella columbipharyngis]|uniref:Antitoxin SocA-like Panacea domain-containing protein n=1 Tax=Riemerella columbipharyngis TaxID=1071918 RepID=A0A1G7FZ25_9FLAO|nr:hypothetical protein [Riemerella columbipharyngis]SDE81153.1 hypothetical protein SAMN05421544_1332 [Riemerella columbipharyngis]